MTDVQPDTQPARLPTIYRYSFDVASADATFDLYGPIVGWGCRNPRTVEFWAWAYRPGDTPTRRTFTVVGTGHPVRHDPPPTHRATVVAPGGNLVWHILELADQ